MCYSGIALAMNRKPDGITRFLDYSVLVPRAISGLLTGLSGDCWLELPEDSLWVF